MKSVLTEYLRLYHNIDVQQKNIHAINCTLIIPPLKKSRKGKKKELKC